MVDDWNNTAFGEEEYQARYDAERDEFCFCDGGLEEWDCFGAKTIESEGKTIKVAHLEDCAEDWKGPGSYIVPLVKQGKDTFTVAAVGRSPGFPPPRGGEKEPRIYRIYPATPQTLEQLKTMPRLER